MPHPYAMYETDIDLAALGLSAKAIESITFDRAQAAFITGVFGVSGVAVPEPGALFLSILGVLGLLLLDWRRPTPAML
jgi:hypothetical protein